MFLSKERKVAFKLALADSSDKARSVSYQGYGVTAPYSVHEIKIQNLWELRFCKTKVG